MFLQWVSQMGELRVISMTGSILRVISHVLINPICDVPTHKQGLTVTISSEPGPNPEGPLMEAAITDADPRGASETKAKGGSRRAGGIRGHFPTIPTPAAVNMELSPLTHALGKVALKTPSTVAVDAKTMAAVAAAPPVINKTQKTTAVLKKERTAALLQAAKVRGGRVGIGLQTILTQVRNTKE